MVLAEISDKLAALGCEFVATGEVPEAEVSLSDAVNWYLFNSQLLSLPNGGMRIVVPQECIKHRAGVGSPESAVFQWAGPIQEIQVFDLKQSMQKRRRPRGRMAAGGAE